MSRKDVASVGQIKSNTTWSSDLQVATTGTVMLGLLGSNKSATNQYIMVFDSSSAVSNGTAPKIHPMHIVAEDNFYIEIPVRGMEFENGIYVANSSTNTTLTKGSADCWFTAVTI